MLDNVERATRENGLLLAVGMIGAPVIWFVHFFFIFGVVDFGCATSLLDYQIASASSIHVLILIATVVAVILALLSGLVALSLWRGSGSRDIEVTDRRAFMGLTGIAFCLISVAAIILSAIPAFVLSTCAGVTGA